MLFRICTLSLLIVSIAHGEAPKSRTFKLEYSTTITGLKHNQSARVWLPIPPSMEEQKLTEIMEHFSVESELKTEPKFGNRLFYLTPKADKNGEISLRVEYTIERKEVLGELKTAAYENLELFMKFDKLAPADGKHLSLLENRKLPSDQTAVGRELYDIVNNRMRYAKEGTEWGRGDVNWVCDSKFGNCTDFHSLFIALSRSQKMPAKFEIGFGLPDKKEGEIAGYHCWAKFKPEGKGWLAVDISEANKNPKMKDYYFGNLTADRVTFSVGRDLVLEPKQDGPPLNFFIYPYVETEGKPYPIEKIKRKFSFVDIESK